jgi:phosphoribosylaminoimidazole-succinocarboxamide synthase
MLELVGSGKVRDMYLIGPSQLLLVASDRISAYDCIMKTTVPGKGKILTQLSLFWFRMLKVPNHFISQESVPSEFAGRAMVVKKLNILPLEAIIRGYLTGSAYSEYIKTQTIHGIPMPPGLKLNEKLPKPLFTPSTKAEQGHDENVHPDVIVSMIGKEMAEKVEAMALDIYEKAAEYALSRGIIIADTKFEFGVDEERNLILADEVLTPDSSRFWDASAYQVGVVQDR